MRSRQTSDAPRGGAQPEVSPLRRAILSPAVWAAVGLVAAACSPDTLYRGDDGDTTGPVVTVSRESVALAVEAPERAELTDSIRAVVTVTSPEGAPPVAEVGLTAQVIRPSTGDTTVVHQVADAPGAGQFLFAFPVPVDDPASLPDTVDLRISAYAISGSGACVAATRPAAQRLACAEFRGDTIADDTLHAQARVVVTSGQTIQLPSEGRIADALVNAAGAPRLFLSNQTAHTVDVLNLRSQAWTRVQVGSQPWGLATSDGGDTVFVANSGGTSISYVSAASLTETKRLPMPNEALFEVAIVPDTLGIKHYTARFYDFSDRPEYLAEDAKGRILFSTFPTVAAPTGTIRQLVRDPSWEQPEVRILFTRGSVQDEPSHWSIAHVDSVLVYPHETTEDQIQIFDHESGYPGRVISSGVKTLENALATLAANPKSDIAYRRGVWDLAALGFRDTTYVTASGDRSTVAFGEGAVGPAGRILVWSAPDSTLSNEISVADLVDNASERVMGLGLNANGSLGVARGREAAYFFNTDLRLQGMYSEGLADGAGGATFQSQTGSAAADTLAFVGTADRTIKVLETAHYQLRGEIAIRDLITGPLRSAPALAEDNQGLSASDPAWVVTRLYGVTSAGGVVVVKVHRYDLRP